VKITPPPRTSDSWGQGHYGASRGKRDHNGKDFACYPMSLIYPEKEGTVTKIGYPYGDDLSFRYIEIKDANDDYARYFYVEPTGAIEVGERVYHSTILGHSQKLGERYSGITEHIHFETFYLQNGIREYFDPDTYYLRV